LLLPLLHGFTPASITEHIPKYCSIEKFIKLPFQRVLIYLNRSPNVGAMAVSHQHCLLSISARATFGDSAISVCGNLILPCYLIHWNRKLHRASENANISNWFFAEVVQDIFITLSFCSCCRSGLAIQVSKPKVTLSYRLVVAAPAQWQTNLILYYDKEYTRYGVTR
jgi:hypothetical protein